MSDLAHKLIKVSTEVKSKAFSPEVCNQTNHPLVDIIKNADLRYLCITVTFQTQKLCPSLLLSLLLHILLPQIVILFLNLSSKENRNDGHVFWI